MPCFICIDTVFGIYKIVVVIWIRVFFVECREAGNGYVDMGIHV